MNVLDSPVEALAFNYVNFGIFAFVNSLWPLVAVVTAALSFWRIKTAAGIVAPVKKLVDEVSYSAPSQPQSFNFRREELSPPCTADIAAMEVSCSSSAEDYICNGVTKGRKFVLYYEDDEGEFTTAAEEEVGEERVKEEWSEGVDEWWGKWEKVLRTRKGEMGWYRYQDTTVINGNVVRLWEECGCGGKYSSAQAVLRRAGNFPTRPVNPTRPDPLFGGLGFDF